MPANSQELPSTPSRRHGAMLLAACLAFCSCSTTDPKPKSDAGVTVPASWKGVSPTAPRNQDVLARWWEQLNDPILNQLVTNALTTSPNLRTALSKIEESRARQGLEKTSLLPTLTANASAANGRNDNRRTGKTVEGETYRGSLDASWELDLFGRQKLAVNAAGAELAQTEENFHAAQVSLAAEIAQNYVTLRAAEAQLSVVERNLEARAETAQLTRWREQAGLGSALETQQAVTSLEQARSSLPTLRQTVATTRNQLALLSGLPPGALDAALSPAATVPAVPAAFALGIPAETLRQRPDIRAAEHAVEAAVARTGAARKERLPSFRLSGSVGLEALKAGRLFAPETTLSSIAGSLSAPIFDAGRIRQNILIQSEIEKQSLIAYESSVLNALTEVENTLTTLQRTAERLGSLGLATDSAREASRLAELTYRAGQADLFTVLDAQRTLLSLEEQQVTTNAGLLAAHIQLYKALGGGWANSLNTK